MAMGESGMTASDVALLTKQNGGDGGGLMGGQGLWAFLIFAIIFGGGGLGGFGGGGGAAAAVSGQITNDFLFTNLNQNLSTGFTAVNSGLQNLGNGLSTLGYENLSNFKDMSAQMSSCCCAIERNIDAVRYENAQNTCAITNAIRVDGDATRALINSNTIQELRDKNQELALGGALLNQSTTILNSLGRYVPYISCPTSC